MTEQELIIHMQTEHRFRDARRLVAVDLLVGTHQDLHSSDVEERVGAEEYLLDVFGESVEASHPGTHDAADLFELDAGEPGPSVHGSGPELHSFIEQ